MMVPGVLFLFMKIQNMESLFTHRNERKRLGATPDRGAAFPRLGLRVQGECDLENKINKLQNLSPAMTIFGKWSNFEKFRGRPTTFNPHKPLFFARLENFFEFSGSWYLNCNISWTI